MKQIVTTALILLISFVALLPLAAQDDSSPEEASLEDAEKIPRKLFIFPAESVSELGMDRRELLEGYAAAYTEYMEIAIAEQTEVVLVDTEEESDSKIRTVLTDVGEGEVGVALFAYDLFFEDEAFKIEQTYTDFSVTSLFETFFPEVIDQVNNYFYPRDPEIIEVVTETVVEEIKVEQVFVQDMSTVTIIGVPGTELETGTGKLYIISDLGIIDIEAPEESTINLVATRPGYFPVNRDIIVGEEDIQVDLEQTKGGRLVLDNRIRIPDFSLVPGIQLFIVPHSLFISFYLDENLLSIGSLVNAIAGYPIIPQIYPTLRVGQFFFRPDSPFRMAFSVGVFTKIVMPFTRAPYISEDMRVGVEPMLLFDFSPWKRLRFFLEVGNRFYYRASETQFGFSDSGGLNGIDNVQLGESNFYMVPAVIFLGVRVYL